MLVLWVKARQYLALPRGVGGEILSSVLLPSSGKKKNHTDNRLLTFFFLSTIQVSLLRGILNVYRAFEEPKDKSVFGHSVRFSGLCTISKTTTGLFLRLFSMMLVIVIVKVKNL